MSLRLEVARPCPMQWSQMKGDDRSRWCGACHQNVYNLSGLTQPEVAMLVSAPQGACVRFFRRADGTVLTADCPRSFSAHFWEQFGAVTNAGVVSLLCGLLWAVFFAVLLNVFGDNLRALFSSSSTGSVSSLSAPPP